MATPFTPSQLYSAGANPNMYNAPTFAPPTPTYAIPGTNERTTNPQQEVLNAQNNGMTSVPGVGMVPQGTYGSAPPKVDPSQPNPATVNANPYTQTPSQNIPVQTAQQVSQALPNTESPATTPEGQKYQSTLQNLNQNGGTAPDSAGQARMAVSQATPPTPAQEYKPTPAFMQYGDPIMQQFIQTALTQSTQIAQSGNLVKSITAQFQGQLSNLNAEEMNLKNMMEGTDDDIRLEISKGGGFATESQVQALVNNRNKDLLKQYNSLEIQKQNMTTQMTSQVQLANLDREYAKDRYDGTMQAYTMYKAMNDNSTDSVNKLVANVGYKGLAAAYEDDPYALSLASQKLGIDLTNPKVVAALETYRERSLQNAANKTYIQGGAGSPISSTNGVLLTTGNMVPSQISAYGGARNAATAEADRLSMEQTGKHYNVIQEELKYAGAKRFASSLNSTQMVRFQGLAGSVVNTIDEVNNLAEEMNNQGIPLTNNLKLQAYINLTGADSDKGQLAARYLGAVNTLKEEFANLANGGYAPTDAAWKLASSQINENYDVNKLKSSLYEVQRLINYRMNAFTNLQPLQIGGGQNEATQGYTVNGAHYYLASDGNYYPD